MHGTASPLHCRAKDTTQHEAAMTSDISLTSVQRACLQMPSLVAQRQHACLCMFNTTRHALCACRYGNEAAEPAAGLVLANLLSTAGQLLDSVHAIYDTLEETVLHFKPTQAGIPCDSDSRNCSLCADHVCSCLSIYSDALG